MTPARHVGDCSMTHVNLVAAPARIRRRRTGAQAEPKQRELVPETPPRGRVHIAAQIPPLKREIVMWTVIRRELQCCRLHRASKTRIGLRTKHAIEREGGGNRRFVPLAGRQQADNYQDQQQAHAQSSLSSGAGSRRDERQAGSTAANAAGRFGSGSAVAAPLMLLCVISGIVLPPLCLLLSVGIFVCEFGGESRDVPCPWADRAGATVGLLGHLALIVLAGGVVLKG